MTTIVRRAHRANPAANTRTHLYTVPTGKKAILRTLTYATENTVAGGVIMGTTISGNGFIWTEKITDTYSSKTFQLSTVLHAGHVVDVEANATVCYFMLEYAEMDEREGGELNLVFHDQIGLSPKTYTVPAGKRFRIKEIVVSPHGNTGADISLNIQNQGYLLRARPNSSGDNIVIATDISVNPGEVVESGASGGTFHAWYSGILEDA